MSEQWSEYLCEYGYQGSRWAFTVKALSWDDARARVKAMGMGQVVGSDVTVYRVPRGLGWLAKLLSGARETPAG